MSTRAIPPLVALTAEPGLIGGDELAHVAAALQTQVANDFGPAWHAPATVAPFPDPATVPAGYWPIVVQATLDEPGALGYHVDASRQPKSYVEHSDDWATTASHELLEMLADPWGNRLVVCQDPRGPEYGQGHVLVEVCDPCEAFGYEVLGVTVSDFVEPSYYGSHHWGFGYVGKGGPASHLGHVQALEVAQGGYLSWRAADGAWWQRTFWQGSAPSDRELAHLDERIAQTGSVRAAIDALVREERAA